MHHTALQAVPPGSQPAVTDVGFDVRESMAVSGHRWDVLYKYTDSNVNYNELWKKNKTKKTNLLVL